MKLPEVNYSDLQVGDRVLSEETNTYGTIMFLDIFIGGETMVEVHWDDGDKTLVMPRLSGYITVDKMDSSVV